MQIVIEKSGSTYAADLQDLPGSPPVGTGPTPEEAVADLFRRLLHPADKDNWVQHIDFSTVTVETR